MPVERIGAAAPGFTVPPNTDLLWSPCAVTRDRRERVEQEGAPQPHLQVH
jgi:hypothetical protein